MLGPSPAANHTMRGCVFTLDTRAYVLLLLLSTHQIDLNRLLDIVFELERPTELFAEMLGFILLKSLTVSGPT